MPGYINPLSAVSIGNASGSDETSLNLMVNIKRAEESSSYAQNTANSNPVDLKKWFETHAINPNITTTKGIYTNVRWSEFRESTIFGCTVKLKNETDSKYDDNNNGQIQIVGINGSKGDSSPCTFTSRILKARGGAELSKIDKASNAADQNMTHTGFNSGTYYVEITNTHPTDITGNVDSMTFGFFWICALSDGTGGKLRSDPTDENSFNTSSRGVRTIIPSNQTTSGSYPNAVASFSDPVTLLCKPRALTTP